MPTPDYPDYTLPIVVIGTVTVVGSVTISGPVTVEGSVSITGTVTVTGDVTVIGAVTISTINADNIVIDKLTVGAYTERRSTLSNYGTEIEWCNRANEYRGGKFFPRGARGFIETIDVYCRNPTDYDSTITLRLSPQPSMGPVTTVTVDVPAYGDEDWRTAYVSIMWNYDSLFISFECSNIYMAVAYTEDAPEDFYSSGDYGVTWFSIEWRALIKVNITGQTVGDLPVSGTLNTIEIMAEASSGYSDEVTVPSGAETSLLTINGTGRVSRCAFHLNDSAIEIRFYVDGTQITPESIIAGDVFTPDLLDIDGYTASTPQIQLTVYNADGICKIAMQIPFEFRRSFELRAYHTIGVDKVVIAGVQVNFKR